MASFTVIREVSEALRTVLVDGLAVVGAPTVSISDLSGTVSTNPATVTLFLYELDEDDCVRNLPPIRRLVGGQIEIEPPPTTLRLRYLVTVWTDDPSSGQTVIGRIVQVLADQYVLGPDKLGGSLRTAGEVLKLTLVPLTLEDRTRVWEAIDKPYRLSVTYEVRGARIESERVSTVVPVRERILDKAKPAPATEGG